MNPCRLSPYERTDDYGQLRPELESSDPRLLNWIGSNDVSGHVREKCLNYLIANFEPGDEHPILLRLADWVLVIRDIARSWIIQNFQNLSPGDYCENGWLIFNLCGRESLRGDPAIQHIQDILIANMYRADPYGLDHYLREVLTPLSLQRNRTLCAWLKRDHWNYNYLQLLEHLVPEDLTEDEVSWFWQNRSVGIRRRFVLYLDEAGGQLPQDRLLAMVVHKNRQLRDLSRFYLERDHDLDVYEIFQQLDGDRFYYIADFARREDVPHFLDGIETSRARIRLNCLRALIGVKPECLREIDLMSVASRDMRNRRLICRYLSGQFYPITGNPPRPAPPRPMVFSKQEADRLLEEIAALPRRKMDPTKFGHFRHKTTKSS